MSDEEIQAIVRKLNNMGEDLVLALREIQDLKERLDNYENQLTRLSNQTPEEASPPE